MKKLILVLAFLCISFSIAFTQETSVPAEQQTTATQSGDFDRAMKLYKQKRYNDAIAEFQKVADTDSKNAAAWYMLGYSHYVLDHHSDSLAAFAKAFQADPSFDPRPYFRR